MRQFWWILMAAWVAMGLLAACQPAPEVATAVPEPTPIPAAAATARQALAQQQQINAELITVVSVTAVTWADSCLGVGTAAESCAAEETPGFEVVLRLNDGDYIYHTNATASDLRLAAAPEIAAADALLTWERNTGQRCETAVVASTAISAGLCAGGLLPAALSAERQQQLAHFSESYAGFVGETAVGTVTFNGTGTETADPTMQRAIAEWAQVAALEAQLGRSSPNDGAIYTYQRQGGIAGFCDTLTVYAAGYATTANCAGEQTASFWLTAAEMTPLYALLDSLAPFNITESDDATADSLTTVLVFNGRGSDGASDANRALLTQQANEILAQDGVRP